MFSLLTVQDIVVMLFGLVCFLVWLIIFFISLKHNAMFDTLEEKKYPLKELYGTGYTVMEMIRYKYQSSFDRKLRAHLGILYEEKYVEYYLRVTYAQSVTIGLIVFLLSFVMYGLARDLIIFLVVLMMAFLAVYYFMTLSSKLIQKRSEKLLGEFSEIVSKLALLINAGMILREAWNEVAYASEGEIYAEMRRACDDMNNGVSDSEAIRRFGVRCLIPEIKKFASTLIQGIEKGNSELAMMLRTQNDEVWEMKQQMVRRAGAKAATKLMIPMFIMFAGILVMIIIPVFTNLGV